MPAAALALAFAALLLAPGPGVAHGRSGFEIEVLSSAPRQATGGDALVEVRVPRGKSKRFVLLRNGQDVTDALERQPDGSWLGLVDGFALGKNRLELRPHRRSRTLLDRLTVENHPESGPIFSGPQQQPFVCTTARVRGSASRSSTTRTASASRVARRGRGRATTRATAAAIPTAEAEIVGWSKDCAARRRVDYQLPLHRRPVPLARRPGRRAARGRRHHHHARRAHRPVHRALGARHDQPLHLQRRDAGARPARRTRSSPTTRCGTGASCSACRAGSRSGTTRAPRARARCCSHDAARLGLRRHELDGPAHEHALQPPARRRDRAHAEGALRRGPRRPALHRRRRRLGRSDPAVRLRAEPPRPARRRRSRSTRTPTWSRRRSTSATASCSSTTSTSPTATTRSGRTR